ncbi:MAG: PEP/pyruvate-binding domain-containing protein, partial [Tissierellaceae bacterium]
MGEYKYIRWFKEIDKHDIPIVGGKGANLGELTQKDLNVPPGFCITAEAYMNFIEYAELDEVIKALMYGLDEEDSSLLNHVSDEIQKRIIKSDIPSLLEEEIIGAYREFSKDIGLIDPEVAVRSSATAEDLPEASFAGQQDTYLHISGEQELINHVRKCWASLWTPRAIYYREKQNFDHFYVSLAVVIQKMVNSEKSGVMFTANPINGNADEIMINSSWGLGEAVVSGIVTPDEYVVNKKSKEVKEIFVAEKNTMVIKDKSGIGTVEVKVADYIGNDYIEKECLTKDELNTLINYGLKIESMYGSFQDIEWGFDRDTRELYILQSRPITTIKGEKEDTKVVQELRVLAKGLPASPGRGVGKVKNIKDISEIDRIEKGDILVT